MLLCNAAMTIVRHGADTTTSIM